MRIALKRKYQFNSCKRYFILQVKTNPFQERILESILLYQAKWNAVFMLHPSKCVITIVSKM